MKTVEVNRLMHSAAPAAVAPIAVAPIAVAPPCGGVRSCAAASVSESRYCRRTNQITVTESDGRVTGTAHRLAEIEPGVEVILDLSHT